MFMISNLHETSVRDSQARPYPLWLLTITKTVQKSFFLPTTPITSHRSTQFMLVSHHICGGENRVKPTNKGTCIFLWSEYSTAKTTRPSHNEHYSALKAKDNLKQQNKFLSSYQAKPPCPLHYGAARQIWNSTDSPHLPAKE